MALSEQLRQVLRTDLQMPSPQTPYVTRILTWNPDNGDIKIQTITSCRDDCCSPIEDHSRFTASTLARCTDCRQILTLDMDLSQQGYLQTYCPLRRVLVRVDVNALKRSLLGSQSLDPQLRNQIIADLTPAEKMFLKD